MIVKPLPTLEERQVLIYRPDDGSLKFLDGMGPPLSVKEMSWSDGVVRYRIEESPLANEHLKYPGVELSLDQLRAIVQFAKERLHE